MITVTRLKGPEGSPLDNLERSATVAPGSTATEPEQPAFCSYRIAEAESFEAALELAGTCPCPFLGGTVQVSEIRELIARC